MELNSDSPGPVKRMAKLKNPEGKEKGLDNELDEKKFEKYFLE